MRISDIMNDSLDALIVALCRDYFRRKTAIEERAVVRRTDTEFRYYNFKIYDAASLVVGEENAEIYIEEIGKKVGYAKSKMDFLSEVTYKKRKRAVMDSIASALHLV